MFSFISLRAAGEATPAPPALAPGASVHHALRAGSAVQVSPVKRDCFGRDAIGATRCAVATT
ncbi:MAG: hypothetical protein EHM33_06735 [Chloroflexi bacterium]|nr:MAG: hypothetical protein EHM33_06735 [Chloroflexota bacterium]